MRLITCIGVEHDLALLPHFVDHYRALGLAARDIIAILNTRDPHSESLADAHAFCEREGMVCVDWIAPYTSETMWEKRRAVQAEFCAHADWVLSADVDEFHRYPEELHAFLSRCDTMGMNVVQGVFVDRLHRDGTLAQVEEGTALFDQFPIAAAAMTIMGGAGAHHTRHSTVKVMALKPPIAPARGGHDPLPYPSVRWLYGASLGQFVAIDRAQYRFAVPTRVDHVHWTDTLRVSLEQRLATEGVSEAGREYGARQLQYLERNNGIDLTDIAVDKGLWPKPDWKTRLSRMRAKGTAMSAAWKIRQLVTRGRA